jgi:hypothetical protein
VLRGARDSDTSNDGLLLLLSETPLLVRLPVLRCMVAMISLFEKQAIDSDSNIFPTKNKSQKL